MRASLNIIKDDSIRELVARLDVSASSISRFCPEGLTAPEPFTAASISRAFLFL